MRAVVEELDLEQCRAHMVRVEHRAGDGAASWVEGRAAEFTRIRCRRFEEFDDGPHPRREAPDAEAGSRTVPPAPLMPVRLASLWDPVPRCHTVAR